MKKAIKKLLCSGLVVLLALTSLPLGGLAGPITNALFANAATNLITDTDDAITRAEWLHNLAVVFEMTVEDEIYPDNYFNDLESTHEYYYDVLLNVNFGVVDVEAGGDVEPDGLVTRSFASHTLNFCLGYQLEDDTYTFSDATTCEYPADAQVAVNRAWLKLVDGAFCPEKTITDKEVKSMLDDAMDVLGKSEIDVDYDSKFTFAPEVIEIEDGTEVEVNDRTITIYDCPEKIQKNDIFAIYKSGIPLVYQAENVSEQEDVTVITATYIEDANGEYILEADAQGEADMEDVIITPAEGVDVSLNYEEPATVFGLQRIGGKKNLSDITAKGSIKLGELGYSVSYSVKLKDPVLQYSYNIGKKSAKVVFECEVEEKLTFGVDLIEGGGFQKEVLIFNLGVMGVGGLDVYLKFGLSGSVSAVIKTDCKVGASYNPVDHFRAIKNFSSNTFSLQVSMSGSVGAVVKLGITQLPFIKAYLYAEAGAKASVDLKIFESGTPKTCVDFAAYIYANYGATFSLKAGAFKFEIKSEEKVWDKKTSPAKMVKHYEDNMPVAACTRGSDPNYRNYYTKYDSIFSGGWSGGNNAYGLNAAGEPVQIFKYSLDENKKATITSYDGNAVIVNVPATIDGYEVIGIGAKAFAYEDMRSVVIPDSVLKIAEGAFLACKILNSVQLSKSVTSMGAYAFGDCDSLVSIEIPKSLTQTTTAYYYDYHYGYCHGVFRASDNLKYVTFEEGTTQIANGLFTACTNITSIVIPDGVTKIGSQAFAACVNLADVVLPKSLITIESDAFRNTAISQIRIPDSVTAIHSGAFLECANLSDVQLSASLKTMGTYAFGNCDSLQRITIPKSLEETTDAYYSDYLYGYHYGVFIASDNLKTIEFEKGTTEIPNGLFANNSSIEEIVIPDTVTKIENAAFGNCENLKSVKLSNSLTVIQSRAFRNTGLTAIDIPDSVKTIADGVFAGCKDLAAVELSKSLETIGAFAFADCESLGAIEIPKKLMSTTDAYYNEYLYGYYCTPFFRCSGLKTVTFEEGTTEIANSLFAYCTGLEAIEIPDSVTVIENRAFNECLNLKSVKLPNALTRIDDAAFYHCKSLDGIQIPATVTKIGANAFNGCAALSDVVVPDSVTAMGDGIFSNCTSLKTASLSDAYPYITKSMFEACASLEKIAFPENIEIVRQYAFKGCISLQEVAFNNNLESIERNAFENNDALTAVTIPDSVSSLGASAFYDCDTLTNVTLGTGLTSIPASTFEHCDALERVSLPYRIASIGSKAFKDCVKFEAITIPRATASIDATAFSYPARLTVYGVPGTYAETFANEIGASFVNNEVTATAASLNKKEVTINKGQQSKLVLTVNPSDFTDEVSWKSSDTSIATIAEDGTLVAKNVGTATIKVTVGNVSASCKVTVVQPVTGVNIDKSSVTMQAFETTQLKLTVNPSNAANKAVKWSSSAEEIASVDENGLVTAHKKGEATIRAEALDGSGKYDTCKVIVANNGVIASSVSELESPHNYPVNCTDFWQFTLNGATGIRVTFDAKTNIEDGFDYLYIYDGKGNEVGKYTGTELAGKTIAINDNTIRIKIVSDDSGTEWGFKVTQIKSDSEGAPAFTDSNTAKLNGNDLVMAAGQTAAQVLSQADGDAVIYDKNGNALSDEQTPGTGMTLVLADNSEYPIVVLGDVEGDGAVSSADARLALRTAVGLEKYADDSAQYKAANVSSADALSASDARSILRVSVGLDNADAWMQ